MKELVCYLQYSGSLTENTSYTYSSRCKFCEILVDIHTCTTGVHQPPCFKGLWLWQWRRWRGEGVVVVLWVFFQGRGFDCIKKKITWNECDPCINRQYLLILVGTVKVRLWKFYKQFTSGNVMLWGTVIILGGGGKYGERYRGMQWRC